MEAVLSLILIVAGFAIFEVLAYRYGAESRRGFVERPERGLVRSA